MGVLYCCHYGFLANRCQKEKLAKIRTYLGRPAEEPPADEEVEAKSCPWPCPKCHKGYMRFCFEYPPIRITGG
ncbi:MAG: hypothetical protein GY731_07105 [Gammaproteobacteria bacterium]|nr:hypothetical protein [Gammaproteobacteria bacterium]